MVRKYSEKRIPYAHAPAIDGGLFFEFPCANLSRIKFIGHSLWEKYRGSVSEVLKRIFLILDFFRTKMSEGV